MMISAQVVKTSVTTTDNSPYQEYTNPDDQTTPSHFTPGSNHLLYFNNCCQGSKLALANSRNASGFSKLRV